MAGDFGRQLRHSRSLGEPRIKQNEIADLISKSPSVISKWESSNENVQRDVAFCERDSLERIASLLRKRKVPEDEISKLEASWHRNVASRGHEQAYDDPLIENLNDTLREIPSSDRSAFTAEIANTLFKWKELKRINTRFDEGKLTFRRAEEEISQLINDAEPSGNRWLSRAMLLQGRQRGYQGKGIQAADDFKVGFDRLSDVGDIDPQLRIRLAIELGDLYRTLESKHWSQAREWYEKVSEIDASDEMAALIDRKLAGIDLFAGTPFAGLKHAKSSLRQSRKTGDREAERKAREFIAWANAMLGNVSTAIAEQKKAHDMATKDVKTHPKEYAKSYRYLGDYYLLAGLTDEARDAYNMALAEVKHISEHKKNAETEQEMVISVWIHLGLSEMLIQTQGDISAIERHLRESLKISNEMGYVIAQGLCFRGFGDYQMREGRLDKALENYLLAMEIFNSNAGLSELSGLADIGPSLFANPYYLSSIELRLAKHRFINGKIEMAYKNALSAKELAEKYSLGIQFTKALLWLAKLRLAGAASSDMEPIDLLIGGISEAANKDELLLTTTLNNVSRIILDDYNLDASSVLNIAIELKEKIAHMDIGSLIETEKQNHIITNWLEKLASHITRLKAQI